MPRIARLYARLRSSSPAKITGRGGEPTARLRLRALGLPTTWRPSATQQGAALDALVSQGYGGAYARKRIETSDGAFGLAGDCAYGEGFISRNPTTHYYLPVNDRALRQARASDHEVMASYSFKLPV